MSNAPGEPPVRVFLSYARADDLVMEFIEPFTTTLRHLAFADRGRELDIFVDRESIGWGQEWQSAIRASIDGATVFMPIITRQYFDRPACREELLTFYSEAKALGVTSLLLPVVLLGHSYISADSQDVAARLVSERQVRDLRDAWLAGPRSETWRTAIFRLAGELVDAATAAERALVEAPAPAALTTGTDDDAPGAAEVGEALDHFGEESQRLVMSLAEVLTRIPEILANPQRLADLSSADARTEMLEIATRLKPHGLAFQNQGRAFESVAARTDETMRAYIRYLREHRMDEILERERASLEGAEEALAPIVEAETYLADFLEQLRPMEVISAPMRHSVRGFREGGMAVRGGIAIMRGWPRITDES